MFEWIASPEAWVALATLMALEIVLGIDNIIFIAILVGRLPPERRDSARRMGLALAMLSRLLLLFGIAWIAQLTTPLFDIANQAISGRDLILLLGGLFLIAKATHEIHNSLESIEDETPAVAGNSVLTVLLQIAALDVIFSLDSVITAVGLVDQISIMVLAIVASVGVMMLAAKPISEFVDNNPTIKMLALSFLIMVGLTLMVESFDVHVPKGYVYFAMAFSMAVEMLNIQLRKKHARKTLQLNKSIQAEPNATD